MSAQRTKWKLLALKQAVQIVTIAPMKSSENSKTDMQKTSTHINRILFLHAQDPLRPKSS